MKSERDQLKEYKKESIWRNTSVDHELIVVSSSGSSSGTIDIEGFYHGCKYLIKYYVEMYTKEERCQASPTVTLISPL